MNTDALNNHASRISHAPLILAVVAFASFVCLMLEWYLAAYVVFVAAAVGAMIAEIALNKTDRRWPVRLFVTAITYLVVNVALFVLLLTFDRFAVLGLLYMFMAVIGGPLLVTSGVLFFSFAQEKPYWLGNIGFVLWMGAVAFANVTVIVIANAGV